MNQEDRRASLAMTAKGVIVMGDLAIFFRLLLFCAFGGTRSVLGVLTV